MYIEARTRWTKGTPSLSTLYFAYVGKYFFEHRVIKNSEPCSSRQYLFTSLRKSTTISIFNDFRPVLEIDLAIVFEHLSPSHPWSYYLIRAGKTLRTTNSGRRRGRSKYATVIYILCIVHATMYRAYYNNVGTVQRVYAQDGSRRRTDARARVRIKTRVSERFQFYSEKKIGNPKKSRSRGARPYTPVARTVRLPAHSSRLVTI